MSNTLSHAEVPFINKELVEHLECLFDIRNIILSKTCNDDYEYLKGMQTVLSYLRTNYEQQLEEGLGG